MMHRWLPLVAAWGWACSIAPSMAAPETTAQQGIAYFERRVRPLLVEHCYECHSAESKKLQGGLLLDSQAGWRRGGDSGPPIVPGKPQESLLFKAVTYEH